MPVPLQYDSGGTFRKNDDPNPLVFREGRILGVDSAEADHLVAKDAEAFIRVNDVASDELNLDAWFDQPQKERLRQIRAGLLDEHLSAISQKALSPEEQDAIEERQNAGGA